MAHLYRLIAIAGLVFLLTPYANAQTSESIPATATQQTARPMWRVDTSQQGSRDYLVALDGCKWSVPVAYGWPASAVVGTRTRDSTSVWCDVSSPPAPFSGGSWAYASAVNSCVGNGQPSTGSCEVAYTCPSGYTLQGTSCVRVKCWDDSYVQPGQECPPQNNCLDYTGGKTEINGRGGLGAKTVCISGGAPFNSGDPNASGCVLTAQADFAAVVDKNIGYEWVAQGTFTGAKCDASTFEEQGTEPVGAADPSSDKQTAPTKCSSGQYPGTVNGVEVCVDPVGGDSTQKQTQKGDTTTNPDGSTTQTQQSQQTTCEGSACTTTTTTTVTTTPAGGGASTTETTTSVGTCTRGSPGCGDEDRDRSSFGGACSAFSCDGDAIMCAVALEQHRRNCQLYGESPESQLYDTEKGKTGPQYASETVNLGPGSFSQVNALGAGAQCISDKTITVAGNTVTLPFSQICSTLQHFGTVLLFIAFLTAYRIVSGR